VICAIMGYAFMSLVFKLRQSSAGKIFNESKAHARSDQSSSTQRQQPQKWFEVLEVAPAASREEIKAAYRSKIFSYHPDRVASLAWEFRKLAEEMSKAINEAYNTGTRLRK
jgi:DnaJ-class molecular chaperone